MVTAELVVNHELFWLQ